MGDYQSAAQVLEENVGLMGEELGTLFTKLKTELVWLHWHWHEFRELFANKESRIQILNDSAPMFFNIIQRILWRDVILGLSHFIAPPRSMGKDNLTLKRLPPLLKDEESKATVLCLISKLESESAFVKDWRNRWLAHKDLNLALDAALKPLLPASREAIEQCLEGCTKVMNAVHMTYSDSTTTYTIGHFSRGAENLLYVLRDGLRREEERDKMLDVGDYGEALFNDDIGPV